jgi:alkylation response protein AidB-like acyl-CoA dehydrogenase
VDLRLSGSELAFRDRLREWLWWTLPTLPPKPERDNWPATLIVEGTGRQRAEHLPRIPRGDEVWCQGFSEPDAGSDLASLRTTAVRGSDDYVVNGRKLWTSHAEVADYRELLVRTDPNAPKHKGITWLILPMNAPGVHVRPLRTAAGSSEFGELILDDVRIPAANRVGTENDGCRVAMVTFSFERGTAFTGTSSNRAIYWPRRWRWRRPLRHAAAACCGMTPHCAATSAGWPPR